MAVPKKETKFRFYLTSQGKKNTKVLKNGQGAILF